MSNTPTLAQLYRGIQISEQIAALEAELAALFSVSPARAIVTEQRATRRSSRISDNVRRTHTRAAGE